MILALLVSNIMKEHDKIEYIIYSINGGYQLVMIGLNYQFRKYVQFGNPQNQGNEDSNHENEEKKEDQHNDKSKRLLDDKLMIYIWWTYVYCICHLLINSGFILIEYYYNSFDIGRVQMVFINYCINTFILMGIRMRLFPFPKQYGTIKGIPKDIKENIVEIFDLCKDFAKYWTFLS